MRKTKKQLEAELVLARMEAQSWKDAHAALVKAVTQCAPHPFYYRFNPAPNPIPQYPFNPYPNPINVPYIWCSDGAPPMSATITSTGNTTVYEVKS